MHLAKTIDARLANSRLVELRGATVSVSEFKRLINEIVRPFDARAVIRREKGKVKYKMKIGGSFAEHRKGKKIYIEILIPRGTKTVELKTRSLNRIIFLTSQTLQHELIHKAQDKRRGEKFYTQRFPVMFSSRIQQKRKVNIQYYSTHEEVDCFAQNIAMELVYNHPLEPIDQLFRNIDKKKSECYRRYTTTFKNTEWSALKRELLKKIWKWLPKVSAPPRI